MAKYYISADLEGVCGVTSVVQCYPKVDTIPYEAAVEQLAIEINTVSAAILAQDAQADIVVNDAHSTMTNLRQSQLHPAITLLSGKPKRCAMMTGLDKSFAGVLLIGYHAKAGTEKGILNHTFHDKLFDVTLNDQSYGEGGLNAFYAGLVHQVPVILASGDAAFCEEIESLMPDLATVETKRGVATTAGLCYPWATVAEIYQRKLTTVLAHSQHWNINIPALAGPYCLQVTFSNSQACDIAMTLPLYKRLDGTTIQIESDDFETVYRALQSTYSMLGYAQYLGC